MMNDELLVPFREKDSARGGIMAPPRVNGSARSTREATGRCIWVRDCEGEARGGIRSNEAARGLRKRSVHLLQRRMRDGYPNRNCLSP